MRRADYCWNLGDLLGIFFCSSLGTEVQTAKNPVHHPLEGLHRVLEGKEHLQELKQAKRGDDRCLGHIIIVHGGLIISSDKIQDGENSGPGSGDGEGLDVG